MMTKERSGILTKQKDSTHLILIISEGGFVQLAIAVALSVSLMGALSGLILAEIFPLGNIETGFKLFDEPKVCITDACVSSADSKIPKRKSSCELPLWK